MASALDMLRHYNIKKKLEKIVDTGDHLVFGKLKWYKKIKTNFMASGPKQDGAPDKFYTLESLVFFLQHMDVWEKSYVRNANYKNISIIHEEDRQAILAYFSGQSSKSIPNLKLMQVSCNEAINPMPKSTEGNVETLNTVHPSPETKQNDVHQPVQAENVQFVRSSDRMNVIKYLNGELDSVDNLNTNVSCALPLNVKRPAIEPSVEQPAETKRAKLTSDPLTMLRQYIIEEKQIIEKGGNVIFGELSWPKNVKTNYQIWGTGQNGKPKEYYTLECLLFFLRNVSQRHPAYVKQAQIEKVPFIKRPDRKRLLDYLKGATCTSDSLDKSMLSTIPSQIKQEEKPHCKEVLAEASLDPAPKSNESEQISLSDALSMERIAAIKAKRLANKGKQLKSN